MSLLIARLRVYAPNAALQGSLPHPVSWEMASPLNDMPSLRINYPSSGAGAAMLLEPCEVAVELRNPETGEYNEHPGCRFLALRRQSDLIEHPGSISFTLPGYGWQLRKIRMLETSGLNEDGRRPFEDATPGQIIGTLIDESKARGNVPGLLYDFTDTTDSAGLSWPLQFSAEYDLGQDVWSAIDALSRQGVVDWRFTGRTLQMYVSDTFLSRNFATDDGIILHPYASHTEEPAERTLEDLAHTLMVIGDEGANTTMESSTALTPWGQWEEVYQAGGVSDTGTMNALAQRVLQSRERARIQYTKQMAWQPGLPVPFVDFRPGDFVRARSDTGNQLEPMRVHQITLNQAETQGIFTSLVLNDRFTERSLRNERWLNRINGVGGPGEGGGSGGEQKPVPPEPQPGPEGRRPAAPQNLQVSSVTYIDATGQPVGRAELTWDLVTTGEDGDPLTPDRYQMATRRNDLPPGLEIAASVPHPENVGFLHPLDGGFEYRFWVRAVSEFGRPGDWSNEIILEIGLSDVPPPRPSIPLLSTKLGTVKVEWDGLTATGTPMPLDFTEVQVEMSDTGGAPWVRIGEIFEAGSAVIATNQPIDVERWFRFIARNSSNLFSTDPSDVASIVVQGVQGPDIEANTITANNIAAGTITAEEIAAYSINVDRLSVGDNSNMIADPLLGDPDLNTNRINIAEMSSADANVWAISNGVATLTKGIAGDTFSRFVLVNNTIITGQFQNNDPLERPGLAIQVTRPITTDGLAGNIMARFRVTVTQGTGAWTANVNVSMLAIFYDQYGAVAGGRIDIVSGVDYSGAGTGVQQSVTGAPINEGASFMLPYVYVQMPDGVPEDVTVSISEFEVWQEASVYIGDGRISAPLIEANAITTDKLAANAITAKHTIQSAQYIMNSASGDPVLHILNSANYVGQAGIRWEGPAFIQAAPRIFMVDGSGTGGWDPNGLVMCGAETTTNDSGRIDLQFAHGITGSYIQRQYGTNTQNQQGIRWQTNNSIFRINGQLPNNNFSNDMFRAVELASATSVNTWTFSWGVANFVYSAVATPGFLNGDDSVTGTNATCLIVRRSAEGMRVVSSRSTTRMNIFAFAGGF